MRDEQEYGRPSPNAPAELSRFAFLIGKWRGEGRLIPDVGAGAFDVRWEGRYILDGFAIADEYRMTAPSGELIVLGLNLRVFDVRNKTWNLKWLNALDGTYLDLGPEELGGVRVDGASISYSMREPMELIFSWSPSATTKSVPFPVTALPNFAAASVVSAISTSRRQPAASSTFQVESAPSANRIPTLTPSTLNGEPSASLLANVASFFFDGAGI
jgi:hypothetical protein